MKYEPLDSKSEQILKLFEKYRVLSVQNVAAKLNIEWFVAADYIRLLEQDKFIGPYSMSVMNPNVITQEMAFIITTKGDIYFDLKRTHKINVIKTSVLIPILVTILTNLVTSLISSLLK